MFRIVVTLNDNFSQSIVHMNILTSFTNKMLKKLGEQTKSIPEAYKKKWESKQQNSEPMVRLYNTMSAPLLTFLHKRLNWEERPNREYQTLDKIFRTLIIKQLPNN